MSFNGAVFVIDDNVQEGQESVVLMVPEPDRGEPIFHALYQIRAVIVALEDVSETVNGTKIASALVSVGSELSNKPITVSKKSHSGGFSIGVALPDADGLDCRMLANNIMESLRFRFGELKSQDIRQSITSIKECLQQVIDILGMPESHRPNIKSLLFEGLVAGLKPSLSLTKRISAMFSNLEVAEGSNDVAFTLLPRQSFPIGSCFFRKGLCIHTTMTRPDLLDTTRFCLLNSILTKTKHDGSLLFCRQVFSDTLKPRMLSVVASGQSAICMIFHCFQMDLIDKHIDPFCITEMKSLLSSMDAELLEQIDHDIARLAKITVSSRDLPSKLVTRHATNEGHHRYAVIPPRPGSAPSSPKIRRRSTMEKTTSAGLASSGNNPSSILRFRVVNRYNGFITEFPVADQDALDLQIADAFRMAIPVIQRRLTPAPLQDDCTDKSDETQDAIKPIPSIQNKREISQTVNWQRFKTPTGFGDGAVESAFHFRIRSIFEDQKIDAFQELGFFVVGRLVPPHYELYLCFEDSIPQDMINLSFQLIFTWI